MRIGLKETHRKIEDKKLKNELERKTRVRMGRESIKQRDREGEKREMEGQ